MKINLISVLLFLGLAFLWFSMSGCGNDAVNSIQPIQGNWPPEGQCGQWSLIENNSCGDLQTRACTLNAQHCMQFQACGQMSWPSCVNAATPLTPAQVVARSGHVGKNK